MSVIVDKNKAVQKPLEQKKPTKRVKKKKT